MGVPFAYSRIVYGVILRQEDLPEDFMYDYLENHNQEEKITELTEGRLSLEWHTDGYNCECTFSLFLTKSRIKSGVENIGVAIEPLPTALIESTKNLPQEQVVADFQKALEFLGANKERAKALRWLHILGLLPPG
jgi:hypothetical protein